MLSLEEMLLRMRRKKALGKAQQYVQENHDGTPIPISVVPHEKDPNYIKKLIKE